MQKFRKTKIVASILTIATLLVTTISPIASAASSFNTEGQVKNALYAAAAYECINNTILQNTAIGNKRESIIPSADTQKVFIGQWLGDANGQITCKDALTKTLGSGTITTNMLNSGQVFNGVYTQSASGEQQIQCNYGIVNSSGNATMDGVYSWPQGYIYDVNGNLVDKRSHGVIQVVFNENGPIRLVGATSDIDTTHTLESMRNWSINWSQPSKICSNLVQYTEVYPIGQVENPMGETISMYAEVLATTDSTPFNEWGIHVDDRYHAWLHYSDKNDQTKKFTHTLSTPTSSSTQLELTSDAKNKLLSNISTLYLNGATDVASFLSSSADAKYILYGRYLFNGDGNGSFACGGISVATDDPDFSNLSATDYWDTSQPYVATVNAYKDSTATSKTTFRTKFGGDGLTSPGAAKSIYFPGVAGDCKALAGEFNNITPTSNTAKAAVKNFMKVGSVEELPDTNTPGSTDPGDDANGGTVGALDGCFSNAGVLGWILCPVLRLASAATNGIYDMIVENYLSVKSETMTSPALRDAWGTFQGYANILFAILLLMVILSQVTGIGLSNYGIKKVLPKLIITIMLVNLSYILCSIAVDLSNIVGVGLNDLLGNAKVTVDGFGDLAASDLNIGTMVMNSVEGIGAAGIAFVAGGALFTVGAEAWPNLILVLFLAVISILISILFFFILLVVRQAAIIILVVIAPVAVVCYALPNTQKLFDRWLKAFSSLLLVFPICGAVMGGCNYASRLLLSAGGNNGLLYYIIVMVLGVVPLFFIPSILKSSMTALGNAGRMLATAGDRFSRWANRSIVGSQAFQDRKQEAQRNVNRARNSRIAESIANNERYKDLVARDKAGQTLTARERRELDRFNFRRSRALAGNRRIFNEDTLAAVTSQGVDYATLSENDPRRLATYRQFSGKESEDLSRGYSTLYQSNGVAGSVAQQQAELDHALTELEKDENNLDAQARFKAVMRMMSNNDKGRAALEQSINKRIQALGANGTDENKGLQWAANTALEGPNGKEFKRVASSLFSTLNRVAEGGTGNRYSTMAADFDANGNLSTSASDAAYSEGIDRMAADILPDIDDREFQKYITGLRNGKIKGADRAKLVSSAIDALNDPRIKLKPKTAKFVHEIANMGYTQNTSSADLHGSNFDNINVNDAAAMAAAGGSELDRIAEGFRNGTIAQDGSGPNDKSDMLNVIQKALEEARLNGGMVGGVELTGSNASKMMKILKDNGRALVDAGGTALSEADYGALMRIKHSRASYSSNWRQATPADITTTPGINVGDWIDVSGTHPRLLNAQELKEVQTVNEFNVRQKVKESADNGTPTP